MTKSVVTRAAMDAMDTQDGYADAIKNVAGVSSSNAKGSANDAVRIRGIQLNLFTDYRLNGGLPITGVMSFPTEDKERIEALKGANALMFGIASPAGIIDLVTKHAGARDVTAASLSGNAFGQAAVSADIGRRFGDDKKFGVRVNLSKAHLENGIEDASGTGSFASAALDWRVSRALSFELDLEDYRKDVVEQASVSLSPVDPKTGKIPVPRVPDPRKLLSGTWDVYHPHTRNEQLRALYKISPGWRATFEVSRSNSDRTRLQDRIDIGTNVDTGQGNNNVTYIANQYETKFTRAEAIGRFDTFGLRNELTLGVSRTDRLSRTSTNPNVQPPGQRQNIYDPVVLAPPVLPAGPLTYADSTSLNTGLYAYDTVHVGERWKVLLGLRETRFDFANTKGRTNGTTSSPAFGVVFDVAPATTLYTSYMKGLEEGAVAPTNKATLNAGEILPPAVATQAELGVRTAYFKGVNLSLAYFDIKRPNAITEPQTGIFANVGLNRFRGIETTLNAELTRVLSLDASGQLMHAVQVSDTEINGKRPENTPRLVASAGLNYKLPIAGVRLRTGVSYVGERSINPQNQGVIPSVLLYSAGLGYNTRIGGHGVSLQFNVDNVANRRYWNSVATGTYGAGMDRSYKFSAKLDY
jgi:iron complex outermembrane receptor protein